MDPELYQKVKRIVSVAWDTPEDEWPALLDKLCGEDEQLRLQVDAFLAEDVDKGFLAKSPLAVDAEGLGEATLVDEIGRIKIDRLIARGGMGEVYVGVDQVLQRQVAVKVMSAGMRLSTERRKAFLNEAQVLSSLQHPNICQIYDFFEDNDRDVLVLELINGKTLGHLMDAGKIKNPIDVAIQIVEALTTAHERGIIHRDLKPDNIMLTKQGQVKILDFGLARSNIDISQAAEANADPKLTQISGTPGYMSPEQARGEQTNSATDLWSFGLVLSELITGNKPFSGKSSSAQLLERARLGKVSLPRNLPKAETALLRRLLAPAAQDRPTARSTLDSLHSIQSRPARRIRATLAFGLLFIVVFAGWKYTNDLKKEQKIAQQALLVAEKQREFAVQARIDAENLIGYMLDELHTGLRAVGKLELLESVANQARNYYANLTDDQLEASDGKAAIALVRLSEVLTDSGRNEEAIGLLERAREILEKVYQNNPDSDSIAYRFGLTLYNLADLYKLAGRIKPARQDFILAVELGRKLTLGLSPGQGPTQSPNATHRWRLLLRSLYLLADSYTRFGGAEKAAEILEEAVKLAIPAANTNPELSVNLADIQYKRCDTYSELNRLDSILGPCLATLELDLALFEKHSDDYQSHRNLLSDYTVMANVYRKLEKYDDSLAAVKEGMRLGQGLIEWDPKNVNTQNEFVGILLAKARLLRATGDLRNSQAVFAQAREVIVPIAADHEEVTFLNHAFVTLVHSGLSEEAGKVAKTLASRGFRRRDFKQLCQEFQIAECMELDQ